MLRPFARTSPRIARLDMTDNWQVLSQLPADPDDAMSVVAIVTKSIKKASRPRLQGWRAITANDIMSILPSDTKDARAVLAIVMGAIEKISRPYARTSSPKPPTKPTG